MKLARLGKLTPGERTDVGTDLAHLSAGPDAFGSSGDRRADRARNVAGLRQ